MGFLLIRKPHVRRVIRIIHPSLQNPGNDVAIACLVHLIGQFDVAEGGFEAPVLRELLECLRREIRSVVGGEHPPEVLEAVAVACGRVLKSG